MIRTYPNYHHIRRMYWADFRQHHPVIMSARMDGSEPQVLVEGLASAATGLAVDAPNHRLYFVDKTIKVVMLDVKHVYVSGFTIFLM